MINSVFLKDIFKVFTGTSLSLLVKTLGSFLLIKYYYSPDEIGYFSFVFSVISILAIFFTLKFEDAIVLPSDKEKSLSVFSFTIGISLRMLLVFVTISFIISLFFFIPYGLFELLIICIGAFLLGLTNTYIAFFNKMDDYLSISINKIIFAVTTLVLQIVLYYTYGNKWGLVIGIVLGYFLSVLFLVVKAKISSKSLSSFKESKNVARNYYKLIKYNFVGVLINVSTQHIQPILLTFIFSAKLAGFYFLTISIVNLPIQLITSSVGQVYFNKINNLFLTNKSEMFDFSLKIVKSIFVVAVLLLSVLYFASQFLFDYYLDIEWAVSMEYIVILLPYILIRALFSPISHLDVVLDKTKLVMIANFIYILSIVLGFVFGGIVNDFIITLYILSFVGVLYYGFLLTYFMKTLHDFTINE